jgi:hypothetical protein
MSSKPKYHPRTAGACAIAARATLRFVVGLTLAGAVASTGTGPLTGCGGSAEQRGDGPTTAALTRRAAEGERRPDELTATGLLGTIRPEHVDEALRAKQSAFLRCFERRLEHLEILSGEVQLAFRIDVQGRVLWVFPKRSTLGDRDMERCILDVARGTRFRAPSGGEAEFTWGMTFPGLDDVRPPVGWPPDRVATQLSAGAAQVGACRAGAAYTITAYVAPGGAVMAAGASTDSESAADAIDCVVGAVRSWRMPDPGSYPAKVTFSVR